MGGGGHGPLVHLSYSSNSGAAKICQRGQSEGAKRQSEGDVGGGNPLPPTVGRFFPNLCMKLTFFCTLDTIIRGSLIIMYWHRPIIPYSFSFFILFLMKVSGKHFPFSLSFSLFSPSKEKKILGGGATAPIAPPGYATELRKVSMEM